MSIWLVAAITLLFIDVCYSAELSKISPGNDSHFKIVPNHDPDFRPCNRKVVVFGVPIYAFHDVEDSKLLFAANIMAQYLDNNEDGNPDNPDVMRAMLKNKAAMFMWKTRKESDANLPGQDLGNDETVPQWHTNGHRGRFDESLEEIWHTITDFGYANAYPDVFGTMSGTNVTNGMDIARGGHYNRVPKQYPKGAWFTYYDHTCDYGCMATEYLYWTMTSILGAQANRGEEIGNEWKLNTRELVKKIDKTIYKLLTDPVYKCPAILPSGKYRA